MNPFRKNMVTAEHATQDYVNFLRVDGIPIIAKRRFLGREYNLQIEKLVGQFQLSHKEIQRISFNPELFSKIIRKGKNYYKWESFETANMPSETSMSHKTIEESYHQLVFELVELQVEDVLLILGQNGTKTLYIDGGFTENKFFVKMMSYFLDDMTIKINSSSMGSALGAALVISKRILNNKSFGLNDQVKIDLLPVDRTD